MGKLHPNLISTLLFSKPSTFLLILLICILTFRTLHHPHSSFSNPQTTLNFHLSFLSSASNSTLAAYLKSLTLHPHLAGTTPSLHTTHFVRSHFSSLGFHTHTAHFSSLLSYPLRSSLSLHNSTHVITIPLSEPHLPSDVIPPYHAYSPSGSALAPPVFVNHGAADDYRILDSLKVNVAGRVVIARRGGELTRHEVVRDAEKRGALALLMYTEDDDDDVRFREGFERGTVLDGVGDPLSPGWGGVEGGERLELEDDEVMKRFPSIPSMPLSVEAAMIILRSLGGEEAPKEWRGGAAGVGRVGPGPNVLNFTYEGEKKVVKIQNVFAVINGSEEQDRYVLLGNHRDAWTYGAVDPNSGTAALLDIARRYALLLDSGWKPRRTIILCSWDAEEFGMVGSTEWVEHNLINIGSKAVAYINVDCAAQGPGFFAGATPQLDNLILEVTKKVKDPDLEGSTVYENWLAANSTIDEIQIQRLSGVDSDFAPFVQHAGVPSVDIYYGKDFPVYHTAFDSYDWMTKFGDPLFHRHVAVAGIWGLIALHLADDSILPFNYLPYADQLKHYKDVLSPLLNGNISLDPLTTAVEEFANAAAEAENEAQKLRKEESTNEFVMLKKRALNDRLMLAERGFLDSDGLEGKHWFKHLIYGPPTYHGSKLFFFPGVADAMNQSQSMKTVQGEAKLQHEIWRVARAIQRAARSLRGGIY